MADDRNASERDSANMVRLGIAAVLVIAVIAFVVDNIDSVKVGFVFTDKKIPLIWVLLITLVIGAVLDRLWQYSRRH